MARPGMHELAPKAWGIFSHGIISFREPLPPFPRIRANLGAPCGALEIATPESFQMLAPKEAFPSCERVNLMGAAGVRLCGHQKKLGHILEGLA